MTLVRIERSDPMGLALEEEAAAGAHPQSA